MRNIVRLLAAAGVGLLAIGAATVEAAEPQYPSRPVRLIVPFAPGGGQDTVGRLLGSRLTEQLGRQFVVDNRPGGGSVVASELVANAPADGHTLYLIEGGFAVAPSIQESLQFDPIKSFQPVARVSAAPGAVVVHSSIPVRSMTELLRLAKAQPGKLTFGSAGIGTASHLAGELLKMMTGIDIVHIAYKGSAAVTTAILSGEVDMALTNPISTLPHVKAGRLKLLAVTTPKRVAVLPEVPTVVESGVPGYENVIWNGVLVRAGTPAAIVEILNREIVKASLSPQVKDQLARDGAVVYGADTPQDFAQFLQSEIAKWNKVVRKAGIKPR